MIKDSGWKHLTLAASKLKLPEASSGHLKNFIEIGVL